MTTGYFDTLGIPITSGRSFDDADGITNAVVVVSATAVRRFFATRDPIGRRLRLGGSDWLTIIGVAGDARYAALDDPSDDVRPMMYVPLRQMSRASASSLGIAIRTAPAPEALAAPARQELQAADANVDVGPIDAMATVLRHATGPQRFTAWLLASFAGIVITLAATGLYGLLVFVVGRRTREIGLRVALGATNRNLVWMTLGRALGLAAVGIGGGLAASRILGGVLDPVLFGVGPTDGVTYAGVALAVLAVTIAASYVPTRTALGIDPVRALRTE